MPFFNAPATNDALTADGNAAGYVAVSSNANYYPGAKVWLSDNGTAGSVECVVTDLSGTTLVGLRKLPTPNVLGVASNAGPQYGRSDVSAWKVANGAKVNQEPSTVRVELSNISKVPLING